jgi:hypothetical protein
LELDRLAFSIAGASAASVEGSFTGRPIITCADASVRV